jgi:hypothetical protein
MQIRVADDLGTCVLSRLGRVRDVVVDDCRGAPGIGLEALIEAGGQHPL